MLCFPGMEHRLRAPKGDWSCPSCIRVTDAKRPVDPPPRAAPAPRRAKRAASDGVLTIQNSSDESDTQLREPKELNEIVS